jgi:hypothetical protein
MAPELVSLEGTDVWTELSPMIRMRLSFLELVNFFSLNIHGERLVCQGASRRLYRDNPDRLSPYLHHLLDEENKHMFYFGRFCQLYAGRTYPDRHIQLPLARAQSEQDFLFYAEILIFEEIVDAYNVAMAADARLHPFVRQINLLHHRDEARHLAFGRALVRTMWHEQASTWPEELRGDLVDTLRAFFTASWREYFNPNVYGDAGLAQPMELRTIAWQSVRSRERRRQLSARCLRTFLALGIDLEGERA